MKSLAILRSGRAVLSAGALILLSAASLVAQPAARVVSAVPGQRTPQQLPPAGKDGIPLTLDQAVGYALANNQDLNVTVNAAEASQFFLFSNYGIYDPLLQAFGTRAHNEQSTASELSGAPVLKSDTSDAGGQVSELTPWGGTFTLGFAGNRTKTNSGFYQVNPSFSAGLTASVNQPLLRGFGQLATNWLIETSRNTRDSAYQDFVRSVQATVNATEQAYWDLAYAYDNLKVKLEAKAIAVELNRITKIKIDVGSLAPIDVVQTEVNIATADQDIINAEGVIGLAQDQLKRQLNFDPTVWNAAAIIPTDPVRVEEQKFNLEDGMKTALSRRPEIISQLYNVSSGQIRYAYFRDQVLPQLNLQASYGNSGGPTVLPDGTILNPGWGGAVDTTFGRDFNNWKVGLVFSYPIFNRAREGQRGRRQVQPGNVEGAADGSRAEHHRGRAQRPPRDRHRRETDRGRGQGARARRAQPRRRTQEVRERHDDRLRGLAAADQPLRRPVARAERPRHLPQGRLGVPQLDRRHPRLEGRQDRGHAGNGAAGDRAAGRSDAGRLRDLPALFAVVPRQAVMEAGAQADTKPPGSDSAFGRFVGVFVSPVRTFTAIAKKPTWLVPLLLWTALSFLIGQLVMTRMDLEQGDPRRASSRRARR